MSLHQRLFIDANLLVLLIVGLFRRDLIERHKKCRSLLFKPADFDLLNKIVLNFESIGLIPNTLTEASNLLRSREEPEKSLLTLQLGDLIRQQEEFFIESNKVSMHAHFSSLGLTDAALLEVMTPEDVLLSTDAVLCTRAQRLGLAAVNFTHARIEAGLIDPA